MKLGVHVDMVGGYAAAVKRVAALGGNTLQMFSTSPQMWGHREVAEKEKELIQRKAELRKKIEQLLKAASAEEERIMDDADRRASQEKGEMLSASSARSREEVRQMLLDAEIKAKKDALVFRGKSDKIISSLFKELERYLKS